MQALSYNNDVINITEPFDGLFTQGMVCHETYKDQKNNWLGPDEIYSENGKFFYKENDISQKVIVGPVESMSKSKKNTIDPEKIILNYGADAVRLFILSDSPPERDVEWSDKGIVASYKFIQKFWDLHKKIKSKKEGVDKTLLKNDKLINEFTNMIITKVNFNLENFRYNVIIANLHEIYSFFNKVTNLEISYKILIDNYIKVLKIMSPIIPHIASECLSDIKESNNLLWPDVDKNHLKSLNKIVVVQINGKKRGIIPIEKSIEEDLLLKKIEEDSDIRKYLVDKKIIKKIYIKDRLINLIIK
jgi:leucyl-tRNA synthetase